MKPDDLLNKVLEACKELGIPTIEEKCKEDEEFKKEVDKRINQSLNDYITIIIVSMISKEEFEQMTGFQSTSFTITKKISDKIHTDYKVLVVKTDVYSVGIVRRSYDDRAYEFIRDAVDRLVIDTYEELEWLIKAAMKYDKERTV